MQVVGSNFSVMDGGMVLCVAIPVVGFARYPVDMEVALADTVANPIETHVDCFGAALFDCVVCDAFGGAVVCGEYGGWLWPSHFS